MAAENFKPFPGFATDAIHAGQEPEQWKSMAVCPPISMSSTFKQTAPAEHASVLYFLFRKTMSKPNRERDSREIRKVKSLVLVELNGEVWWPGYIEDEKIMFWGERYVSFVEEPIDIEEESYLEESNRQEEEEEELEDEKKDRHTKRKTKNTRKRWTSAEGFEYSRSGNPTRQCLEKCLAAIEGGKHGICTSSGLAATLTVTHLLSAGDHIISIDDVYGGTNRYFSQCASKFGIEISFIDCTVVENVQNALKDNTKLVWMETPTNPTMKIVDIAAIVKVVKAKNSNIIVVVDNTFMSSYFQRPLSLGADISMHSLTKYMNGHSDVVMGALILNCDKLNDKLRFLQNALGPVPSPFDCFLVNRGLKTLHVRMKEHMANGLAVAKFLSENSRVEKVIHPGLPSHPQYEIGKKQMRGYSGMVTFFIKGGMKESRAFLKAVKVFTLAESLGGFESLCELPAVQTHASVPADQREKLGITDTLIRLSVGIEDVDDLIQDIDQALKAAIP